MKRRKPSKKPAYQLKIARERIDILFSEASAAKDKKLAKRYIQLARRIGMRYNIRLRKYRRNFCRKCHSYLLPGKTSSHSIKKHFLNITCLSCNNVMRIPLKKKQLRGRN